MYMKEELIITTIQFKLFRRKKRLEKVYFRNPKNILILKIFY